MLIFKTLAEFQAVVSVTNASTFQAMEGAMRRALNTYLIPYLSQAQYTALETKYLNDTYTLTSNESKLLTIAQKILANFTFVLHLPMTSVMSSDSGLHRFENDQNKPLFKYQENNIRKERIQAGWEAVEEMLAFLESNAFSFFDWAASTSYTVYKENFIRNATEFSDFVNISESRFLFFKMKNVISRIERKQIRNILGIDLYAEIKAQIQGNSLTQENWYLIELIKPILAHLTIITAIKESLIDIQANGSFTFSANSDQELQEKQQPGDNRLYATALYHQDQASEDTKILVDFLQANTTTYPLFLTSGMYKDPTIKPTPLNLPDETSFFL